MFHASSFSRVLYHSLSIQLKCSKMCRKMSYVFGYQIDWKCLLIYMKHVVYCRKLDFTLTWYAMFNSLFLSHQFNIYRIVIFDISHPVSSFSGKILISLTTFQSKSSVIFSFGFCCASKFDTKILHDSCVYNVLSSESLVGFIKCKQKLFANEYCARMLEVSDFLMAPFPKQPYNCVNLTF